MKQMPLDDLLMTSAIDDDEIDELFAQLEQMQPPQDMVATIMHAVSQLPRPKPLSTWNALDIFQPDFDESQLC